VVGLGLVKLLHSSFVDLVS